MSNTELTLPELGWKPVCQQQLSLEELETGRISRVLAVHRDHLVVHDGQAEISLPMTGMWHTVAPDEKPTVGDWLLLAIDTDQILRLLPRQTLLKRVAAGEDARPQLIAANLDTLFIVSSCNADFNLSRLERYLALSLSAGIEPVVILTKADLSENSEAFQEQAQSLRHDLQVITLNALADECRQLLLPWLGKGQTVAFVGSSGVGKSTLTNLFSEKERQLTQEIREQDAKGRHTTTSRQMLRMETGAWIIDTPGMRELRLGDSREGVESLFEDLEALSGQCRYNNCQHGDDAGCALNLAVGEERLDPRRLQSYLKLLRETERAAQTPWQQRQKFKAFGKMAKNAQLAKKSQREG